MITITLQYETLGQAQRALARLQEVAAEKATGQLMADIAIEKAKVVDAPKSAPPVKAVAEPSTVAGGTPAPTAVTSQPAPTPTETTKATEAPTYDVVSKAITDKVKTNRDHVVAVLAKFGAKKGTELKAEQYSDFLAAL